MATSPPALPLASLLAEEVRTVEEFLAILKQEEVALIATDLDPLLALAARKGEYTAKLNALVERRESVLKSSGLPPGREDMGKWVAVTDKSGQAAKLWTQLLSLATQARSQNEINGKLIALHFQHNQRALNTLMAATDTAMTYGADGQQQGRSGGRLLGSA